MRPGRPMVLIIVDGWGIAAPWGGNATSVAKSPIINELWRTAPKSILGAAEGSVGLPVGERGNSEVGHLNIGCGQIVHQDLPSISATIKDGSFYDNERLKSAFDYVKKNKSQIHLMGLLSDGGVHSHISHLFALLEMAKREGVSDVFIHIFTDGRDTAPAEALRYLGLLERKIQEVGVGVIASVSGRYYAMDRENRWERVEPVYRVLTEGTGQESLSPAAAISDAYRKGQSDEFIVATAIRDKDQVKHFIKDNDAIIFFNYRADRARELTQALVRPDFRNFRRGTVRNDLYFVAFTSYQEGLPVEVAFSPRLVSQPLAKVFSDLGWRQLHIAETAKYPHVTYFFNGGVEAPFGREDRIMIESPKVATYEQKPEMSAPKLTDEIIKKLKKYDFIVVNFANLDMVGHSGNIRATTQAVEVVDGCLGRIKKEIIRIHGSLIVTADHGNAEQMINNATGGPDTEHTTNPVPFFFVNTYKPITLRSSGILSDIAPTILDYLSIPIPPEMTGKSLLINQNVEGQI
ncbi:MAG: 2,3-bisphosphoglycerate-independent phosphoglycerate mutase [bacterium]|nr:2,3-bisphosphoglycerate-independent phosphoglycerate mutase [bacterium]